MLPNRDESSNQTVLLCFAHIFQDCLHFINLGPPGSHFGHDHLAGHKELQRNR